VGINGVLTVFFTRSVQNNIASQCVIGQWIKSSNSIGSICGGGIRLVVQLVVELVMGNRTDRTLQRSLSRQQASARCKRTGHASVAGEQVGLELAEARSPALQLGVRYPDEAGATSRAASVDKRQDVRLAAEVSHVQLHAPAQGHAAVEGPVHEDDLVAGARSPEHLGVTVLTHVQLARATCRQQREARRRHADFAPGRVIR